MQVHVLHSVLAMVAASFASAIPVAQRDCQYPTFKLVNPLYGVWASGKYASMAGDEFEFNKNDSASAQTYTLDAATGQLYGNGNALAYWLGLVPGHDAAVRFQSASFVASTSGALYLTCKTPAVDGDVFSCQGDDSGQYGRFNMCYANEGGQGLGIVEGNSTGPYPTPGPIKNWLYCGGVEAQVADLACGSAPVVSS